MTFAKISALALLLSGASLLSLPASAALQEQAFGTTFTSAAEVGPQQAQVVFYRTVTGDDFEDPGAAHLYVDGEYQSALLPGGYTRFCVAPGSHSLAAFTADAPAYSGKREQPYFSTLEGGKTYFVKVGDGVTGAPTAVGRNDAMRELAGTRLQQHTLSRASAVQACQLLPETKKQFVLSGDTLFPFGKSSRQDITHAGREAVSDMIASIRSEMTGPVKISIVGHTDAIGREGANYRLGARRAATVRGMMIDAGIPARMLTASSAGSSEPVVNGCSGSRAEQIECMAPNRRVTVIVDTRPQGE